MYANDPAIYQSDAAQTWKYQVQQLAREQFDDPQLWARADNHWLKAMYRAGHSPTLTVLVYYLVPDDRLWHYAQRCVSFSSRDLPQATRQQKRARSQVNKKRYACMQGFLSSQRDVARYDPSVAPLA
jgi:hypothetical protein